MATALNTNYLNNLLNGNTWFTSEGNKNTSPYYNPEIQKMYDQALAARNAAIDSEVKTGTMEYQKKIDEAPKTYQPLRNETFTQNAIAERALKERMANMGLGATGGTSQTLDTKRQMEMQNRLGDITRDQQQFVSDQGFEINKLASQGEYQKAQALAEIQAQAQQAMLDNYWQEYQAKQAEIDRYYQMFANGHMTAAQFKKKTGITVQQAKRRSSGGGNKDKDIPFEKLMDMLRKEMEKNNATNSGASGSTNPQGSSFNYVY